MRRSKSRWKSFSIHALLLNLIHHEIITIYNSCTHTDIYSTRSTYYTLSLSRPEFHCLVSALSQLCLCIADSTVPAGCKCSGTSVVDRWPRHTFLLHEWDTESVKPRIHTHSMESFISSGTILILAWLEFTWEWSTGRAAISRGFRTSDTTHSRTWVIFDTCREHEQHARRLHCDTEIAERQAHQGLKTFELCHRHARTEQHSASFLSACSGGPNCQLFPPLSNTRHCH